MNVDEFIEANKLLHDFKATEKHFFQASVAAGAFFMPI